MPVAKREFVFREQFVFLNSSNDPSPADRDLESFGAVSVLGFGATRNLALFGVVATYQTLDFQVDAQVSYLATTKANAFEFGDIVQLDASLQYRLWPRTLGAGVPGFLYGVVEANLTHQDKNEINGVEDPNSGGALLFLVPGLQYVTKRWIVEAGVQLPAVQALNGTALENDYIVRAGFRINF